jgi:hypothetical protein
MRVSFDGCVSLGLSLLAAACTGQIGGGGGGRDDGGASGSDGGTSVDGGLPDAFTADAFVADAAAPETPLTDRLAVVTIATPDGVLAGDSSWRIWGSASLRVSPVFTVPFADCGTLVGFTTGTGTGTRAPTARVARLDASDALVATYDLGPYVLRGLAAEPDGHFAALLWNPVPDPAVLHVARFDAAGGPGWSTELLDELAAPTDFGIGESRLEYGHGKYGAYYHVHGISGFAMGHEGDQLEWLDGGTGAMTNGWSWGCSHSMSELLRFEPQSSKFLSACVTDCYPGTSGSDFSTSSIGGVYLEHQRKVLDVDGGCNGKVAGELGGAAPAPGGWKLVFNAHQAAATPGQSSYQSSTMNQDIGFVSVATNLSPGAVVWLTTTTGNENNASVARWQPAGDDAEQYLVGWVESSGGSRHYQLARVSAAGAILSPPVDVSALAKWGERDDPFREHRNHDVVWSWFDAAGATSFHFARLRSSQVATCTSI